MIAATSEASPYAAGINLEQQFDIILWSVRMSDEAEDPSLSQFDEATRHGLERVKPRVLASNPRCPDCWSGPMMHIAHPWRPCEMQDIGAAEVCGCTSTRRV